jgi:energy-coupling factor transporter ATP-binding protein EcfA2
MSITKDSVTRRDIYKDQVDEISLKMKKGSVVLHGGRGVGKTTVCVWIQEKLSDATGGANVQIMNGRDPARAEQDLESIAGNKVILIDNLDVLLISVKHNEDLLKRIVTKLSALIPTVEQINAGSRLLVTTTIDLWRLGWSWLKGVELPEWWNAYSSFVQQSTQIRLDPWPLYWQSIWEQDFNDEFAGTMDADVLESWRTAIIELTGGHPALYGPALEQLRILSKKQEPSDSADARLM